MTLPMYEATGDPITRRYTSKEDSQNDHKENYRSDGYAKGKGTQNSSDAIRVQWILGNTPEGAYVLDVGCNGGTVSIPLRDLRKCRVKGIDLVPELVELAKGRGVFAEQGEAEDLSRFDDETFDVVICSEVLEHLYDPIPAVKEAYRVLKKGGKYLVTVPNVDGEMCEKGKLGDYHQANFTREMLRNMFINPFKEKNVKEIGIPYIDSYIQTIATSKEEFERIQKIAQWVALEATK